MSKNEVCYYSGLIFYSILQVFFIKDPRQVIDPLVLCHYNAIRDTEKLESSRRASAPLQ